MYVIHARNVNDALPKGVELLTDEGQIRPSRNGNVCVTICPVTTVYERPRERVLFDPLRDANPFFHFFESLWMLGGRNDLAYVKTFAKNMANYSDDGKTLWGAYGWRWRSFFGFDQIQWAIDRLRKEPNDRRVIIGMWSAKDDSERANEDGKDVPCNTTLHLQLNTAGALDLTVFCRSNDIIWGAYGANVVHMSFLLEYIAQALGVGVGRYYQISNNFHAYEDLFRKLQAIEQEVKCNYTTETVTSFSLMASSGVEKHWDQDLAMFLDEPMAVGFRHAFFRKIAKPLMAAHISIRIKDYGAAHDNLAQMPKGNDWKLAAEQWVDRRQAAYLKAQEEREDV